MKPCYLIGLLSWLAGFPALAQLSDSSLYVRSSFLVPVNTWSQARNPAGLLEVPMPDYSRTGLHVLRQAGAYRRPQQAGENRQAGFHSEGLKRLNNWRLQGSFDYQKHEDRDQRWGNTANPLSGNPFVWADEFGGDWQRDHIHLQLAAAYPLTARWRLGLLTQYQVGQGARLNTPKPFYRFRTIALRPGVQWALSEQTWVGGWVAYQSSREENQVGYYSSQNPQLYRLRGYGSFDRSSVVTSDLLTTGNAWGWGLQVGKHLPRTRTLLVSVTLHQLEEQGLEGISTIRLNGRYTQRKGTVSAELERRAMNQLKRFSLSGTYQFGAGEDPVFQAVNVQTFHQNLGLTWTRQGQHGLKSRQFQGKIFYQGQSIQNILNQTSWVIDQLEAGGRVIFRRPVSSRWSFFTESALTGFYSLSSQYKALRPTELTPVLVTPDFHHLGAHRAELETELGLDHPFQKGFLRISGRVWFQQSLSSTASGHRLLTRLTLQFFNYAQ